jgi:hypothetical protein
VHPALSPPCLGYALWWMGQITGGLPRVLTADSIPHSHLISLIKLRTNSQSLNIEMLRHTMPRVPRSNLTCPWCHTLCALHDERHCVLECPHLVAQARLRYPTVYGPGTEARDMRTMFTAERFGLPLCLRLCTTSHTQNFMLALPQGVATTVSTPT